jgi:hypothetical protein
VQSMMRTSFISLMLVGTMFSCEKFTQYLNQGLEEEKSYTRHAMEAYRKKPDGFRESRNVLETWSRADYIALAVLKQKRQGNWAESSDKMEFLDAKLKLDTGGTPFCVIQQEGHILVLSIRSEPVSTCSMDLAKKINIDGIKSGDMEFSGRSDFWVYVLRVERTAQP